MTSGKELAALQAAARLCRVLDGTAGDPRSPQGPISGPAVEELRVRLLEVGFEEREVRAI